jgi:hypothetical protein
MECNWKRWAFDVKTRRRNNPCPFLPIKCATLDRQIDRLVYELYDLTPEEIAIVEGMGK